MEDDVNGVSVHTETVLQESAKHCTNDNQIFMVDVLTPSGEILTVVVADEMPPNTSSFGIGEYLEIINVTYFLISQCLIDYTLVVF